MILSSKYLEFSIKIMLTDDLIIKTLEFLIQIMLIDVLIILNLGIFNWNCVDWWFDHYKPWIFFWNFGDWWLYHQKPCNFQLKLCWLTIWSVKALECSLENMLIDDLIILNLGIFNSNFVDWWFYHFKSWNFQFKLCWLMIWSF